MQFLRSCTLTLLLVALIAPVHAQIPDPEGPILDLRITELLPTPLPGGFEFVELYNSGSEAADLSGSWISDHSGSRYIFPEGSLAPPQAHTIIWVGNDNHTFGHNWPRTAIFNTAGDIAGLYYPYGGAPLQRFAYGDASSPNITAEAAPGQSYTWTPEGWILTDPTPGYATNHTQAGFEAYVPSFAPELVWKGIPDRAAKGSTHLVDLQATDGNGDLQHWNLTSNGTILAEGFDESVSQIELTAPSEIGTWALTFAAVDATNQSVQQDFLIDVFSDGLQLKFPHGDALSFGSLTPGGNATSNLIIEITNNDFEALTPYVDITDLIGPGGTIALANRLVMLVDDVEVLYTGPLTQLPALEPLETATLGFRIDGLPQHLPAGPLGASFALVA